MTLDLAEAGAEYRLTSVNASAKTRSKLETLGLVPGEQIRILSTTGAGFIIEVKRCRLAIARDIAESVAVVPWGGHKKASDAQPSVNVVRKGSAMA